MVKSIVVVAIFFCSFGVKAKRFIVHYQNFKSQASTKNNAGAGTSVAIVEASSKSQVKGQFPIGTIVHVEEDILLKASLEPGEAGDGDTYYESQWHYYEKTGGIELPSAWDITTGKEDIVVAVVDTGIVEHPDLKENVLLGADLISDVGIANDGDGRDNDSSDPGDWIERGDSCFQGFENNSSWHGTHVAGTVSARSDNGMGVTGVSWQSKILPVRVLGKCGGWLSDIAEGIRWAAGGRVVGVSDNANPADVINLSLGGVGPCGATMQAAIDFAVSKGAVVIVAAGNDQQDLDFTSYVPANCRNVINVGASNRNSFRAFYSNYGQSIDVMAPGGDFSGNVFSTSNDGAKTPNRPSYKGLSGTSMAAPHVAGVVALMKSVAPNLFPAQIEDILKKTTKFLNCNREGGCGSGLVDAFSAINLARTTVPDGSFQGTEPINSNPEPVEDNRRLIASDDSDGGMCGSVAFVDGGKPPRGGLGAFFFSLCLGLLLSFLAKAPSGLRVKRLIAGVT